MQVFIAPSNLVIFNSFLLDVVAEILEFLEPSKVRVAQAVAYVTTI